MTKQSYGIKIDLDNETYVARALKNKEYCNYTFDAEPTGALYLVWVSGRDGDSNGSYPESWEVDVFASKEEAEALADSIDFNYDVYTMLRNSRWSSSIPHDVSDEQKVLLEQIYATFEKMNNNEKDSYKESIEEVPYTKDGVSLKTHGYQWKGHFSSMEQVHVVELGPLGKSMKRWRKRG